MFSSPSQGKPDQRDLQSGSAIRTDNKVELDRGLVRKRLLSSRTFLPYESYNIFSKIFTILGQTSAV